jgi:hypothetical protein
VALSASNKEAAHFSLGLKAVETAALWKRLEKSKSDFPTPSHRAWKTRSPLHSEFPTVPTASTASSIYFLLKALDKELSPSLAGLGSLRTITSIFREPDTSLAIKTGHLDLLTTLISCMRSHVVSAVLESLGVRYNSRQGRVLSLSRPSGTRRLARGNWPSGELNERITPDAGSAVCYRDCLSLL